MEKRRATDRRGMFFVGVMIASVTLFAGVFGFHYFMRESRRLTYRSTQVEYAQSLARAGLEVTQIHLARALRDPQSTAHRRLVAPLAELTSGGEELGSVDLAEAYPQLVERLARFLPRGRASVEGLEARFGVSAKDAAPLPPLTMGERTLPRGEREKRGLLWVEVTARVSTGGLFGTVSRVVRAQYEFRVVDAPVPLLSDFTLFAQERPPSGKGTTGGLGYLHFRDGVTTKDNPSAYWNSMLAMRERGWLFAGDPPGARSELRPMLPPIWLPDPWVAPLGNLELARIDLPSLTPQLGRVACWNVPAATGFRPFLEARGVLTESVLDLGTTVRGTGPLELPALTAVQRGGVLMASEITLTGSIPAPAHGALVLVATEGSIRVPAGVTINAQLVALKGAVVMTGTPQVNGSVAAAHLELSGLTRGAEVAYDTRFKSRPFASGPGDNLIVDFARKPTLIE